MSSETRKSPFDLVYELSLPLIAGVIAAIVWANLDAHGYHSFLHWSPFGDTSHYNFHFLFNDIFMVFFFGIAAGEITESCLPGGALNPVSRAINPLMATAGGVLGPVAVFFIWMYASGDHSIANGWGIPTATDIALAWLVARLAFGKGHPAVSFLLLLAVADDGIGLGIIAIFYPDPNNPVEPAFLGLVAAAMASAWMMRKQGIKSFWLFLAGPGVMSWFGLYLAHLHPALALVAVIPFMPHMAEDLGMYADEGHMTDTLNRFQHFFQKPVDIGLFGFGLANAGVMFSSIGNATWAVLCALLIGKTLGVTLFSMVGNAIGFKYPEGMDTRTVFLAGMTAGLGLTVALFVAGQAFPVGSELQGAAKMGALFSAGAVIPVLILAKLLRVKESATTTDTESADH
jgi:NhaA family Na+:H+ antiporter